MARELVTLMFSLLLLHVVDRDPEPAGRPRRPDAKRGDHGGELARRLLGHVQVEPPRGDARAVVVGTPSSVVRSMHDLRRVHGHRRAHVSQLAVPRVFTGVSEVDVELERAFAVPGPYSLRPFLLSVPARPMGWDWFDVTREESG